MGWSGQPLCYVTAASLPSWGFSFQMKPMAADLCAGGGNKSKVPCTHCGKDRPVSCRDLLRLELVTHVGAAQKNPAFVFKSEC